MKVILVVHLSPEDLTLIGRCYGRQDSRRPPRASYDEALDFLRHTIAQRLGRKHTLREDLEPGRRVVGR